MSAESPYECVRRGDESCEYRLSGPCAIAVSWVAKSSPVAAGFDWRRVNDSDMLQMPFGEAKLVI